MTENPKAVEDFNTTDPGASGLQAFLDDPIVNRPRRSWPIRSLLIFFLILVLLCVGLYWLMKPVGLRDVPIYEAGMIFHYVLPEGEWFARITNEGEESEGGMGNKLHPYIEAERVFLLSDVFLDEVMQTPDWQDGPQALQAFTKDDIRQVIWMNPEPYGWLRFVSVYHPDREVVETLGWAIFQTYQQDRRARLSPAGVTEWDKVADHLDQQYEKLSELKRLESKHQVPTFDFEQGDKAAWDKQYQAWKEIDDAIRKLKSEILSNQSLIAEIEARELGVGVAYLQPDVELVNPATGFREEVFASIGDIQLAVLRLRLKHAGIGLIFLVPAIGLLCFQLWKLTR